MRPSLTFCALLCLAGSACAGFASRSDQAPRFDEPSVQAAVVAHLGLSPLVFVVSDESALPEELRDDPAVQASVEPRARPMLADLLRRNRHAVRLVLSAPATAVPHVFAWPHRSWPRARIAPIWMAATARSLHLATEWIVPTQLSRPGFDPTGTRALVVLTHVWPQVDTVKTPLWTLELELGNEGWRAVRLQRIPPYFDPM